MGLIPWSLVGKAARWAVKRGLEQRRGGRFLSKREQERKFLSQNRGILLDGSGKRLSEKDSFQHLAVVAQTGWGKTTNFVLPNLYTLARQPCSIVLTDPKGECFEHSSGYLRSKGFEVLALNPLNLAASIRYNPIAHARGFLDLNRISEILVGVTPKAKEEDRYWMGNAATILNILMASLKNRGEQYAGLHNVSRLLAHFGADGSGIDSFVLGSLRKPDGSEDDSLFEAYKGFISASEKNLQTFVAMARNALRMYADDRLVQLTASNSLDFASLRTRKTALFLILPPEEAQNFRFLTDLLYTQLFSSLTSKLPEKKELSVYCLMDEFGNHAAIPNMASIFTTIRAYRVCLSIILQSLSQLEEVYGEQGAQTILSGGIGTKLFGGAEGSTAQKVEALIGKQWSTWPLVSTTTLETPVLSAAEISALSENEAIVFTRHCSPARMSVTPFYMQAWMVRQSRRPPVSTARMIHPPVQWIEW